MRMEVRGIFGEDEISGEDETFDCSNMNPLNQAVMLFLAFANERNDMKMYFIVLHVIL